MKTKFKEFTGGASATVFVLVAIVITVLAVVTHGMPPWVGYLAPLATAAVAILFLFSTGMGCRSKPHRGRDR
ncbi:hypothetical protein DLJ54_07005 [Corynebacterium heidelbergense]|uniref:Uncharacterized protein n=1 Tax=Corynebacterium heidelbergense TaxID=2055947 RepID=A0A364V527_9CORY|nr:hypothetical protein DLJ54_07005 [Corynebacterium heidelbergense]